MWAILIPPLVLGGIGLVLGLLINLVAQKFAVEDDRRIDEIEHLLPNYNCGACGYPGCHGMAEAILAGEATAAKCKPIKKEEIEILQKYLDSLKEGAKNVQEAK
jgi:electron transport complex protein RnfB